MENLSEPFIDTNNPEVPEFDDFEPFLENELAGSIKFEGYIDKLELVDKTDEELKQMDPLDIVNFKNTQITKLKQYIGSLQKEIEDLLLNYKETTNLLLEKIKNFEEQSIGTRPQTAMIVKKIDNGLSRDSSATKNSFTQESSKEDILTLQEVKQIIAQNSKRCVHCKQFFDCSTFQEHSLSCIRLLAKIGTFKLARFAKK